METIKKMIIITGILALLTGMLVFLLNPISWLAMMNWVKILQSNPGKYENQVEAYLEKEYNEPFDITEVDYNSVFDRYVMKGHPANNPKLQFNAAYYEDSDGSEIRDDYRVKKDVNPIIEKIFPGEDYYYEVEYISPTVAIDKFKSEEESEWKTMISQYPRVVSIRIELFTLVEPKSKFSYEKILQLSSSIKNLKFENVGLFIRYYGNQEMSEEYFHNEIKHGVDSFRSNHQEQMISYEIENLSSICTAQDVINELNLN